MPSKTKMVIVDEQQNRIESAGRPKIQRSGLIVFMRGRQHHALSLNPALLVYSSYCYGFCLKGTVRPKIKIQSLTPPVPTESQVKSLSL